MGRINNRGLYPYDHALSLDDFLLGSNADDADKTQNYLLRGVFSTFKTSLNLASLEYIFAGGADPDLDHTDEGYFTTNGNQTLAGAITSININKLDLNLIDITSLVSTVSGNISSFVLKLSKPSAVGQIFYFAIDSIVDNTTHYTIGVTNFVGGNSLEDETTYTLSFDLSGVPSVLTETDPVFLAHPAAGVTALKITQWDTAFGWGNHASAGYQAALSGTGIVKSTAGVISYLTDNSTNWNTAFGWGNHAIVGYLTSESDPVFLAHPAAGVTALRLTQWDTAFGWGNHATQGYLTSFSESDPIFSASPASSITNLNKTEWTTAYGWGDHEAVGYVEYKGTWNASTNTPTLANPPASTTKGDYYVVSVAGTQFSLSFQAGDWIVSNGSAWEKVNNSPAEWGSITGTIALQTDLQNEFVNVTGDTMTGNLLVENGTSAQNVAVRRTVGGVLFQSALALDGDGKATFIADNITTPESFSLRMHPTTGAEFIDNSNGIVATIDSLGNLAVDGNATATTLGFNDSVNGNANDFLTFMPLANSIFSDSNSTGSTNYPTEFGQTLFVRGATSNRSFALWKANGDNSLHYIGNYNTGLATWQWNQLWHSGNLTPTDYVEVAGDTMTGALRFGDNINVFFGSSDDMQIVHDATNNIIRLNNGNLLIRDGATTRFTFERTTGNLSLVGDLTATGVSVSESVDGETSISVTNSSTGVNSRASLLLLGQGNNFWIRNWGDSSAQPNETEFLSTAGGSTFMFTPNNTDVLQMASTGITLQGSSNFTMGASAGSTFIHNNQASKDKIRVWSSDSYSIGMTNGLSYGPIVNDFAMTFGMSNTTTRGWLWYDASHTASQGAMALSTQGKLTVASHTRIGYGESDTTVPGTTYMLQVNGNIQASNFTLSSDERLKTNIKDLSPTPMSVRWRKFDWIEGEKGQLGVVAQELQKDHPEFVIEDEQGYLGVKYTDLLIAKMAEKDRQIDDLERRMQQIEKLLKLRK